MERRWNYSSLNLRSKFFLVFAEIFHFDPFSHESVPRGICQPIRTQRFRNPRAGARVNRWPSPTSDACGDATRVYPGRGAPRFASARRRGAVEARRRRVSVTFFAHVYSCTQRAFFLTATDTSAPASADRVRGARGAFWGVPRAAHGRRRPSRPSPRSFAWTSRAARVGSCGDGGRDFLARMGIVSERVPRGK